MLYTVLKIYLLLINGITFLVFGLDKWKAARRKWRISEKTLFRLSLVGGSIGGILGMVLFRHKTKHIRFILAMPFILVLQIFACWFIRQIML